MRLTTPRVIGVTLALIGTALTTTLAGPASSDDGSRKVDFTVNQPVTGATFTQSFTFDPSRCHFDASFTLQSPCVIPVTPLAGLDYQYSGDITGVAKSSESAIMAAQNLLSATANDAQFTGLFRVEATITHCGAGSFILRRDGNAASPDATWMIVPGSGRGKLVGLTGHGSDTSGFDGPHGTLEFQATGTVRCQRHS